MPSGPAGCSGCSPTPSGPLGAPRPPLGPPRTWPGCTRTWWTAAGTAQVFSGGRLVTAAGLRVRRSCRSSAGRDLNDTSERPAPVPPVGRWPAWGVARQLLGTAYRLDEATSKMIWTLRCDNGSPTTSGDRSRGGGGGRCMDRGTPTPLRSRWLPAADPDRRRSRRCCRSQACRGSDAWAGGCAPLGSVARLACRTPAAGRARLVPALG